MTRIPPPQIITEEQLDDLHRRLRARRVLSLPGDAWSLGVPRDWLGDLIEEWLAFDPPRIQARVDALEHHRVEIDGQSLHVLTASGEGERPQPLVLTNGWPSSFLEYLRLVPLLTRAGSPTPGGDTPDCFTVVIPALPGYGFSSAPTRPLSTRTIAGLWDRLMVDHLGHRGYVAHGSDLGGGVTGWLAVDHPAGVRAVHLASPHLPPPPDPRAEPEAEFADHLREWTRTEGGYAHMHSTRPATLAAALLDSPVGLAAWIGEKFRAWSDRDPLADAPTHELLLATLTLYWSTGTIGTSLLPYWANSASGQRLPIDAPPPQPAGVDLFRGERVPFPQIPQSLAERHFQLARFADHPQGGHFPAASVPELLDGVLRATFGVAPPVTV